MAITKAGRLITGLFTKEVPNDIQLELEKDKKRQKLWRGISDKEFAKELLRAELEIEATTYQQVCALVMSDLSQISGEELKSQLRGLQGRLIAVRTLMLKFIPNFDPESIKIEED